MIGGEDVDLAMHTIAAATALDYPRGSFGVIILDDGGGVVMRHSVVLFDKRRKDGGAKCVGYMSSRRAPDLPTCFKAGYRNSGLEVMDRVSGAAFVASLDIDMIPRSNWLRAVLPHMLLDEKVAMATPLAVRGAPSRCCDQAHIVSDVAADACSQNGKRENFSTVPCRDRLFSMFEVRL